jgi:hypothetical protein
MRPRVILVFLSFVVGCAGTVATPPVAAPAPTTPPILASSSVTPPVATAIPVAATATAPGQAPVAAIPPRLPRPADVATESEPPPVVGSQRADGTRDDGLQVTVLLPGSGPPTQTGDRVDVHYVGTLLDGRQFDSSRTKGRAPFRFVLGKGTVIKGWEEGLVGMQVGEVRRLTIPSPLAYGEKGRLPTIPPHSTLVFEIELRSFDPR